MKKKLKLLVTGSNGLIAKTFIKTYNKDYKIITCTKNDSLSLALKSRPDMIVNAAGDQYDETRMLNTNLNLVIRLLEYCKKNKSKLIQFGSSAEYGLCKKPSNEDFKLNPATLYEATKSAASMMVTGYSKAYSIKAIVVRPYSVYGHHMKLDRLIMMIINNLNSNKKMNIYRAKHDFIYVKDFNRALNTIIKKNDKWEYGEIINIGSEKQLSNEQVMKIITKVFKNKGNFQVIDKFYKPWDSDNWVSNCKHLRKKYNFKLHYSFEKGMKDFKNELYKDSQSQLKKL